MSGGYGGNTPMGYGGSQNGYGSRMGAPMGGNSAQWPPRGGGYRHEASTMDMRSPQQNWGPSGFTGMEYQSPAPTPFPPSAQPKPDYGSRFGAPMGPLQNQPPFPQMSPEFRSRDPGQPGVIDPGRNMISSQDSAPGFMVNQRMGGPQPQLPGMPNMANEAPGFDPMQRYNAPKAPPPQSPQDTRQSFDQFAATLGNNGMTSGQMQDAYQKSLQPASTNFWQNTGVGTQRPQGFQTPDAWGQQTYGFDPRAMAGKQVGKDMGWYYGQDAIGRTINNAGDAVPSFGAPADGFQRSRPWFGR